MTPGNNFGIGTPGGATVTGNIIEENTVIGNTSGIILFAGSAGNLLRKNFVVGNPPVQASADYPSATPGVDIRNLATPGANAFVGNTCITSVNAPCPVLEPSLTANPNPIPVAGSDEYGKTTISWMAPGMQEVEVRVGSPNGPLFGSGDRGSSETGAWVADGMTFYLQDVADGKELTAENTLATVVIRFLRR